MQFIRPYLYNIIRPTVCCTYVSHIINFNLRRIKCNKNSNYIQQFKKSQTSIVLFSLSWFSSQTKPASISKEEEEFKKRQDLLVTADSLFQLNKHREICELLAPFKDGQDVELLWRLVRAQYNLAQEIHTAESERKELIMEGFNIICRSLSLDGAHFANHKWMSIMLDAKSCYHGIKARITQLETVKHHMQRAVELNPRDATTLYMLGVWCFEIANMPWYQRKIASTVFATPPESSFDEALKYFMKAEETEPRFYSMNLLMLGKTYMQLNKTDRAKYYLELAATYPVTTDDDIRAKKEATELLKKL